MGRGVVVLGTVTYRGALVTFLSSLSLRHKSVGTRREKYKSPASPCSLPASLSLGPQCPIAPCPTLPPCLAAPSAQGCLFGPAPPSPLALLGHPRKGATVSIESGQQGREGEQTDRRMDRGMAVPLPLGHSCL